MRCLAIALVKYLKLGWTTRCGEVKVTAVTERENEA